MKRLRIPPGRLQDLACLLLLISVVIGCKQFEHIVRPTVLRSADGKFQITVPAGWSERHSLNAEASIAAVNPREETYVIVITENKSDFASDITLDKFTEVIRDRMSSKLKFPQVTPPTPVTINGKPGRQYLLQGEGKLVKLTYLVTMVETDEHFHQIITWTLTSRIDQNQGVLDQVTNSFRKVPADK